MELFVTREFFSIIDVTFLPIGDTCEDTEQALSRTSDWFCRSEALRHQISIPSSPRPMVAKQRCSIRDLYSIGWAFGLMSALSVLFDHFHSINAFHSMDMVLTSAQMHYAVCPVKLRFVLAMNGLCSNNARVSRKIVYHVQFPTYTRLLGHTWYDMPLIWEPKGVLKLGNGEIKISTKCATCTNTTTLCIKKSRAISLEPRKMW